MLPLPPSLMAVAAGNGMARSMSWRRDRAVDGVTTGPFVLSHESLKRLCRQMNL